MSHGFEAIGNNSRLLINDVTPVLTQMFWGSIIVNVLVPANIEFDDFGSDFPVSYGYCSVTYSTPYLSQVPPLVFALPTKWMTPAGLGLFAHTGGPGAWTGFTVLVTRDVLCQEWWYMEAGWDTGWEYRVCGFAQAGDAGMDEYGMRIWGPPPELKVIYDTAWPVVRFKGLLGGWSLHGYTRFYEVFTYWGDRETDNVDIDYTIATGSHAWGYADWTTGFLLSAIGTIGTSVDIGDDDVDFTAVVLVGFPNPGLRDRLYACAVIGKSQHPAGDVSALNVWKMLLADFTGT